MQGVLKFRLFLTVILAAISSLFVTDIYGQANITVDVNQVIKILPSNAVGMNINYLMDGSYISSATTGSTAAALKAMNNKMLRYPGGEKSDNYAWSSAPFDKSNPSVLLTGACQWPSGDNRFVQSDFKTSKPEVLDFDEFMVMARSVGAEPMLVCAYDAAYYGGSIAATNPCGIKPTLDELINTAKEWVRYANKTKNYNVKYWCIGNESWNDCDYNGCVTADQYAIDVVKFSTAMRAIDPSIKIIANGLEAEWWQKLVSNPASAKAIDYLGVSCYPVFNYSGGYEDYRNNNYDLRDDVKVAAEAINKFASAADKLRLKVIGTEFNAIDWSGSWVDRNDIGHALLSAEILAQSIRTPEVESMLFWNTRWVDNLTKADDIYDALDKNSATNASGLMLTAMYNAFLPRMVKVTEEGKIKSFAFYDAASGKLNVVLINKDNQSQSANLSINGFSSRISCARWEYKGLDMNDTEPSYARRDSVTVSSYPYLISLPRNSITILKIAPANIALPLPLLAFTATLETNGYGQLSWQTNSADNSSSFSIQRSSDSITWSTIGNLPSDATGTNRSYEFSDTNPFANSAKVYYRIVKTDASGQVYVSMVRSLQKIISTSLTIRLLNSPGGQSVNFTVNGIRYAALNINLLDAKGRIVKTFPSVASDGLVTLDLSPVPRGIYFVQFISSVAQQTFKLVKGR